MSGPSAPGDPSSNPVHHDVGTSPGEGKKIWDSWLKAIIAINGSDLIIKSGLAPRIRHKGQLQPLKCPVVKPEDLFSLLGIIKKIIY